jgi:hypothetical protein
MFSTIGVATTADRAVDTLCDLGSYPHESTRQREAVMLAALDAMMRAVTPATDEKGEQL